MNNEFYIGWMPAAPPALSKHLGKVAIALVATIIFAGLILSSGQRKFSTASFEFGKRTEVTGIYQSFPIPSLKVNTSKDLFGHTTYITLPLVGYGKFGADGIINDLEKDYGMKLDNREITFRGSLLYSDGKALLQIDEHDQPVKKIGDTMTETHHDVKEMGLVILTGEILDPKCYFGVMKPGHGKPHKDCAIRCIEGGISPVFYVRNNEGVANYYLLLNKDGQRINQEVKDLIATPLQLTAKAVKYDDWIVLYVDPASFKPTGGMSWFKLNDNTVSCGPVK